MLKNNVFLVFLTIFLVSCSNSPQPFDSEKWKSGGKALRGSMIQDVKDQNILNGKSRTEVEQLLGKPDSTSNSGYGYNVITIERCYFWRCRLEIEFNPQTGTITKQVSVSD